MNWLLQTINKIGKPLDQLSKRKKKQGRNERRIGKEGGESQINRIRN